MSKNSISNYLAANSAAKLRILDAARELFSEHGVAGTSLQMIADAIGVTKAAVYHQYKAKEEIVYAVGEQVNLALEAMIETALLEPTVSKRRKVLIDQMVSLAVANRHIAGMLQHDPQFLRLFREEKPFIDVMDELNNVLVGDNQEPEARVIAAALVTSFAGVVMHPICDDVDDETLEKQMIKIASKLVKLL